MKDAVLSRIVVPEMEWLENSTPNPQALEMSDFPQAHWWWLLDSQQGGNKFAQRSRSLILSAADGFRRDGASALIDGFTPGILSSAFIERGSSLETQDVVEQDVDEESKKIFALLKVLTGNEDIVAPVLPSGAQCAKPDPNLTPSVEDVAAQDQAKVVIGVIDDGIAIANRAFRLSDSEEKGPETTRVVSLWQQDADCVQQDGGPVFGRAYSKLEIDAALATASENGLINEQKVYRRLGLRMRGQPPGRFPGNVTHGTHVTGLAAGEIQQHRDVKDSINASPQHFPIVAVNLPTGIVSDTAGSFLASAVILGIQHIIETAQMIEGDRRVPIVINLSFSLQGSGMGGARLIAQYIDTVIEASRQQGRTVIFVLPAGNNFQDSLVGRMTIPAHAHGTALFEISPDNSATTFVECVVERRKRISLLSDFRLELISIENGVLGDDVPGQVNLRSSWRLEETLGDQIRVKSGVYHGFRLDRPFDPTDIDNAMGQEVITLALPAHMPRSGEASNSIAGAWTIKLHNRSDSDATVTVRILRNDDPLGDWTRQSAKLLNPQEPFTTTCQISQSYTLNAIAVGSSAVVVGARYANAPVLSPYSSSGPITPLDGGADKAGVTLHAPADRSASEPGLLGPAAISDTQNGRSKAQSGTSVAAPLVSRWFVNYLIRNEGATTAEAVAAILTVATQAPTPDDTVDKDGSRTGIGGLTHKLAG